MTEKEFMEWQGNDSFFCQLLVYYNMSTTDYERKCQKETEILFFEFPEGTYSIMLKDLKEKAEAEKAKLVAKALKDKSKKKSGDNGKTIS